MKPRPNHYWYGISNVESAKNLIYKFTQKGYRIIEADCDGIVMLNDSTNSRVELSISTNTVQEANDWLYGLEDHLNIRMHSVAMEYIDKE